MNSLLFLYLNLVRGPQIVEQRRLKEEEARRAKEAEEIASGKLSKTVGCKKCDAQLDRLSVPIGARPLCATCGAKEAQELAEAKRQMRHEIKMSPFLWFQSFVMLLGLTVFFHRNVMPLF